MTMADCSTKIIMAVDFDGTLCKNAFPNIGEPKLDIIEKVIDLQRRGTFIILWTCRELDTLEQALKWCKKYGLVPDAVNDQAPWIKESFECVDEIRQILSAENGRCGAKIFAHHY